MTNFGKSIQHYFGKENFEKLQRVHIGIAGCGGLGSNCAHNLVRCGICKLTLVDFDVVEPANLNRQFYFSEQIGLKKIEALSQNLVKINPDLQITSYCQKLESNNILKIFESCEIVIEAFDQAEYKSLLVETLLPTGKFIVSASGLAGFGNSDDIKTHHLKDNLVLIGDLRSEANRSLPPLSPRVNVAAAKQADAVLAHILKNL